MDMRTDDLEQMKEHLMLRPDVLMRHIEQQFSVQRSIVQLEFSGAGKVKVNSLTVEASRSLGYFSGIEIRLEAIAQDGYEFVEWSGTIRSEQTVLYIDPTDATRIKAKFAKKGSGGYLLQDGFEEGTSIGIP